MAIDRIDGSGSFNPPEKLENEAQGSTGRSSSTPGRAEDKVEMSAEARQVAALADKVKSLPEVRQEKVEEIRRSLAQGTYEVDARQVARAMLEFEDGFGG